jgi:glycosyltransferase involved in cell wall biosynthesis
MAHFAVVSYRLGGTDGVAIESAKWTHALTSLGHIVTTVAGEGTADFIIDGLAIGATSPPSLERLREVLAACDVVIVENIASLPLNVGARDALYELLDGRRAIFHHHDLAWQREHLAHLEGPRSQHRWRHVTINDRSRRELLERGVEAVTMMNSFDCDPPVGGRTTTRDALGVGTEVLVLFPSRVIARKNIAAALQLSASLGAVLWILGPAEDGYGPTLEQLINEAGVEVRRGLPPGFEIHDAYAASDLVVMSSTWEGFGNPVLESVTHRRPLALHRYPVAEEIVAYGFEFFNLDDVNGISRFLTNSDEVLLEANLEIARRHFNVADLPRRLATLLAPLNVTN